MAESREQTMIRIGEGAHSVRGAHAWITEEALVWLYAYGDGALADRVEKGLEIADRAAAEFDAVWDALFADEKTGKRAAPL